MVQNMNSMGQLKRQSFSVDAPAGQTIQKPFTLPTGRGVVYAVGFLAGNGFDNDLELGTFKLAINNVEVFIDQNLLNYAKSTEEFPKVENVDGWAEGSVINTTLVNGSAAPLKLNVILFYKPK
jgi:hypothetical protein